MQFSRFSVFVAVVSLVACSEGVTEPKCARCGELRVITDRPEYRPGRVVAFTITNRTSAVLRYDWCSVGLASRAFSGEFEVLYSPARRCGLGAGLAEVLEHMVLIQPGESRRDSVSLSGAANQSQYRVHIWLLDDNGVPEGGNPVASNTFDVFPGASASRGWR